MRSMPPLERGAILGVVAKLVDHAACGRGGALFLIADAGLGKTTILEHARRLSARGVRVVASEGDPAESGFPFGYMRTALSDNRLGDVVPGGGNAAHAAAIDWWIAARRWISDLARCPTLLLLDDLHWADAGSLRFLSLICRRLPDLPVAVVAGLRRWPRDAAEVCEAWADSRYVSVETLEPLSERAGTAVLTESARWALPAPAARRVWRHCAGNPFLLVEAATTVAREGSQETSWRLSRLDLPPHRLRRFLGVQGPALRCARAASVLGTRFRMDVATAVANLSDQEAEEALEALCASGLLLQQGGSFAVFAHPLVRRALYAGIPAPIRTWLHARAFVVLRAKGIGLEALRHAIRGDLVGDDDAVTLLEQAGRASVTAGSLAVGVRRLEAATRLAGERARPELLLGVAEALVERGRPATAIELCERAMNHQEITASVRSEASWVLGRALHAVGDGPGAAAKFETASKLPSANPDRAVGIMVESALTLWRQIGVVDALDSAYRALEHAGHGQAAARQQAEEAWRHLALLRGDPSAAEAWRDGTIDPTFDLRVRASNISANWRLLDACAQTCRLIERLDESERMLRQGRNMAARVGATHAHAALSMSLVETLVRRGRLHAALTIAQHLSDLPDLVPALESSAELCHARVLLELGRGRECEACCARAEAIAVEREEHLALVWLWHLRGQRWLDEDQPQDACVAYQRVEAASRRLGLGEPCLVPWAGHAINAHLRAGQVDEAERTVAWFENACERLPCRWPRIAVAVGRAHLAERVGDLGKAAELFRIALGLHEHVDLPLELIRAQVDYGTFLRRHRNPTSARPLLAEALRSAEEMGAATLAAMAHRELAVAGGRRRGSKVHKELTAQERRVADLAAAGRSNREIAVCLSLSERTVKCHLERVYAKLEIHSRRELMLNGGLLAIPARSAATSG